MVHEDKILEYFVNRLNEISEIKDNLRDVIDRKAKQIVIITGIGGIGKTTLLIKLKRELREQFQEIPRILIDMDIKKVHSATGFYSIPPSYQRLFRISSYLKRKFNVDFLKFEFMYTMFLKENLGVEPVKIEGTSKAIVDVVVDFLKSFVPFMSLIPSLIKRGILKAKEKKRFKKIEEWLKTTLGENYQERLGDIILEKTEDLYPYVVKAFVSDIKNAISENKIKAMVILVDSAEYISDLDSEVILQLLSEIKPIFIVFVGREISNVLHNSFKKISDLEIKYIDLKALEPEDAEEFLSRKGITSMQIKETIISTTGGIPQLLSLLADYANQLISSNIPLEPEMFKTSKREVKEILDEYLEKIIEHVKQGNPLAKEVIYVSSIPYRISLDFITSVLESKWVTKRQIEEAFNLVTRIESIYSSISLKQVQTYAQQDYNSYNSDNMIEQVDKHRADNRNTDEYIMHDEVRKILLSRMPPDEKQKLAKMALKFFNKKFQKTRDPTFLAEKLNAFMIINENNATKLLIYEVKNAISNANYSTAEIILEAYRPLSPENIIIKKTLLADFFIHLSNIQKAIDILKSVISFKPSTISGWNHLCIALEILGEAYLRSGNLESAIEILKSAVNAYDKILEITESKIPEILNNKGNVLEVLGETFLRKNDLDSAIDGFKFAIKSYDKALKLTNNQFKDALFNKGIALRMLGESLLHKNDTENAILALTSAINVYDFLLSIQKSQNPDVLNNKSIAFNSLAKVYIAQNKIDLAFQILNKALDACNSALNLTDNKLISAQINLASIYRSFSNAALKNNDVDVAISNLESAVNSYNLALSSLNYRDPHTMYDLANTLTLLGSLSSKKNNLQKSKKAFNDAIDILEKLKNKGSLWKNIAENSIDNIKQQLKKLSDQS